MSFPDSAGHLFSMPHAKKYHFSFEQKTQQCRAVFSNITSFKETKFSFHILKGIYFHQPNRKSVFLSLHNSPKKIISERQFVTLDGAL